MYTRISRSGGRTYLQLVEAYRDEAGKPRQRVVANLGRLDQLTPARLDPLINGLERALGRSRRPAKPVHYDASLAFGDLFALTELWNELGMGTALSRALRSSHRQFDAGAQRGQIYFPRAQRGQIYFPLGNRSVPVVVRPRCALCPALTLIRQ